SARHRARQKSEFRAAPTPPLHTRSRASDPDRWRGSAISRVAQPRRAASVERHLRSVAACPDAVRGEHGWRLITPGLPNGIKAYQILFRQPTSIETSIRNVQRVLIEAVLVVAAVLWYSVARSRQ